MTTDSTAAGEAEREGETGSDLEHPAGTGIDVDGADEEEAAAIVAALSLHLRERAGDDEREGDATPPWDGHRWTFAGRVDDIDGWPVRVPQSAPRDAWTASDRTDRM